MVKVLSACRADEGRNKEIKKKGTKILVEFHRESSRSVVVCGGRMSTVYVSVNQPPPLQFSLPVSNPAPPVTQINIALFPTHGLCLRWWIEPSNQAFHQSIHPVAITQKQIQFY